MILHRLTRIYPLLAAAADKFGSINLDKVVYINSIYGINEAGSLPGEVEGKLYFNFGGLVGYDRDAHYDGRSSGGCGDGSVWVLQPDDDGYINFTAQCMDILGHVNDPAVNAVHFTDMVETYTTATDAVGNPIPGFDFIDNVRAFTQATDDALQVLEYIHNYKVPEVLYPAP